MAMLLSLHGLIFAFENIWRARVQFAIQSANDEMSLWAAQPLVFFCVPKDDAFAIIWSKPLRVFGVPAAPVMAAETVETVVLAAGPFQSRYFDRAAAIARG